MMAAKSQKEKEAKPARESWRATATAAMHCGSGCTLGDILAEAILLAAPLTLLGRPIFAAWALDYALALLLGVAFQYFTIKPMQHLRPGPALVKALQADFLSLTAWQVGMYAWMGFVTFGIFRQELPETAPVFWFQMQIAMLCGFATSYPVNAWLLRRGVKAEM